MIVYVRILLHVLAGWLLASGWINEEIKTLVTTDEQVALGVQALLAGIIHGISVVWWRLASRFGWAK